MRRNSSAATSRSIPSTSLPICSSEAPSLSARASSNSSRASATPLPTRFSVSATDSRAFFSLPSSCARCGLSHSLGSSSSRFSASSLRSFASKSKIPPQLGGAGVEPGERGGDLVDAFGFHGGAKKGVNYTLRVGSRCYRKQRQRPEPLAAVQKRSMEM
jgi:hypothetical protein